MKKIFLIFCLFSSSFLLSNSNVKEPVKIEKASRYDRRVSELNKEINELEDFKAELEGKISRYEDKAQRLQFQDGRLQEAKKYWKMADTKRRALKEVDSKLIIKKKERAALLRN